MKTMGSGDRDPHILKLGTRWKELRCTMGDSIDHKFERIDVLQKGNAPSCLKSKSGVWAVSPFIRVYDRWDRPK